MNPPSSSVSPTRTPPRADMPLPQLDFANIKSEDSESEFEKLVTIPTLPLADVVPRITGNTLSDMLSGVYDEFFESLFIIDNRFHYENVGGSIQGSVNITSPEILSEEFFSQPYPNSIIVFHCEFSQNRGPDAAELFRGFDRDLNKDRYPFLFYPNVYILDGGYKKFYEEHREWCNGGYISMFDNKHVENGDLVKATSEYRNCVEQVKKEHRKALVDISNHASASMFMSPTVDCSLKSPMATKMLNFLASPGYNRV